MRLGADEVVTPYVVLALRTQPNREESAQEVARGTHSSAREKPHKESPSASVPKEAVAAPPVPPPAPPIPGRGGPQHKYLQDLIRRWAEDRGYSVTVEKEVLDGMGIVDLVRERRGAEPIACEISVTTSPEHEIQNAQKCLVAGYARGCRPPTEPDEAGPVRSAVAGLRGGVGS